MTLIIYNKQQKGYTEYYRKGEVVQKIYFTAHWPIKIYHISCRKSAHSEFLYAFSYTVLQSPVCVDDFCRHYASPEKKECFGQKK